MSYIFTLPVTHILKVVSKISPKMSSDQIESERIWRESSKIEWSPPKNSQIVNFYTGKNVLVTGATGFLGKLLVEKLLRACPDIGTIFILVRSKKGEDEHTRVDKLYSDEVKATIFLKVKLL